ncbi:NAD(P)-dependent alcohol dehydrogenase [Nonomuraea sp. SMC257]|uniref:NAD(P)-dependent alcohol dehydrogenase n=1 Tax=Nonomuraea montanisoli TaxID=2741721 RepID=A0A7Y6M579_9ACTN|nr:NAD(P)-dependent alcohol dehydrogenase [Nonomuraea montanisoli]NUW34351.1 NAD(P)-dependent alcohol dehydrogenase [Nonomuraea montanisoli]
MKAIVQDRYGPPAVLELREVDKPSPAADEVLVRVHAASVNALDWHFMRGHPYVPRVVMGLRRPRVPIRGRDFAGRVEAVGREVTRLRPGDEVYGEADGTFAEYVCARADAVDLKPANLTFEQAAAMPLAANTALLGLRDAGQVRPGQKVLINGASGGVGTFAVQVAAALGAEVTAVCRARNADLARSLGAEHVIDYTSEDFTRSGRRYDVVFDGVATRRLTDLRRAVTPTGTLLLAGGGEPGGVLGAMGLLFKALAVKPFVRQRLVPVMGPAPRRENLAALRELAEAGKITPVIERSYPLDEAPAAIRHMEVEHARAKLVINVA